MGGKSKPPPAPDYSPIAQASAESARISAEVAREQLAWAKEQYAQDKEITSRVVDSQIAAQEQLNKFAADDRRRYEMLFQPMEDNVLLDAAGFTPERNQARAEAAAGRATADVSNQFAMARAAAQDRLESFGIDPSQTRAQALDVSARMSEAAARAGAGTSVYDQTLRAEEATGRALRSEAVNIGRGYPGQVAGTYGLALQAGSAGAQTALAQTASGAQTMGTGPQWQATGNQALNIWGNTLNMSHQNQMARYNAQQQQSSGWGSALGSVLGAGAGLFMMSDIDEKEAIEEVGKLNDGQPVYRFRLKGSPTTQIGLIAQNVEKRRPDAVAQDAQGRKYVNYKAATQSAVNVRGGEGSGPVVSFATGGAVDPSFAYANSGAGVPITTRMNPSMGGPSGTDTVKAALTPGEFVVPNDVVQWKGQEWFHKQIAAARKAAETPVVKPVVNEPAVQEPTTVQPPPVANKGTGAGNYTYDEKMKLINDARAAKGMGPYNDPHAATRGVPPGSAPAGGTASSPAVGLDTGRGGMPPAHTQALQPTQSMGGGTPINPATGLPYPADYGIQTPYGRVIPGVRTINPPLSNGGRGRPDLSGLTPQQQGLFQMETLYFNMHQQQQAYNWGGFDQSGGGEGVGAGGQSTGNEGQSSAGGQARGAGGGASNQGDSW
jgi:hypothetical protein